MSPTNRRLAADGASLIEVQVDRIVGPTHHFGGLGVGNVASARHGGQPSNPAAAAIEGLDKMRRVAGLGVPQLVLPPQPRPATHWLQSLGFRGPEMFRQALDEAPAVLAAAMSCSAMWTANAATVCPLVESRNHELTITVANLCGSLHRSVEPDTTLAELKRLFGAIAKVQPPLSGGAAMRDEGAANHMRLSVAGSHAALHLFVYGDGDPPPRTHWPRQTLAASQAVARTLDILPEQLVFLKQHPRAIDAGAFHNDVVAMSHDNLLIHHQLAFTDTDAPGSITEIEARFEQLLGCQLNRIEVADDVLSLEDAVSTYLFNSQIVSVFDENQPPVLICPAQVADHPGAKRLVDAWVQQGIFSQQHYVDLGQSMAGGGGPACLRLRVPVTPTQLGKLPAVARWTPQLDDQIRNAIDRHYPQHISLAELADPSLLEQCQRAATFVRECIECY